MSLSRSDGKAIDLSAGATLTENYRTAYPGQTISAFIGSNHITDLMDQTGAVGIRVYFGQEDGGENTIVMVAAKANEDDILDLIIDNAKREPPCTASANDLNS